MNLTRRKSCLRLLACCACAHALKSLAAQACTLCCSWKVSSLHCICLSVGKQMPCSPESEGSCLHLLCSLHQVARETKCSIKPYRLQQMLSTNPAYNIVTHCHQHTICTNLLSSACIPKFLQGCWETVCTKDNRHKSGLEPHRGSSCVLAMCLTCSGLVCIHPYP